MNLKSTTGIALTKCIILFFLLFPLYRSLATGLPSLKTTNTDDAKVTLLEHPYPYKASLTFIADTHHGTLGHNIEEFEAIHDLINSTKFISRGSDTWKILDLGRLESEEYSEGINGFGFPFADTFFFYDRYFGFFVDFDVSTGNFVRHSNKDLEAYFRKWHELGYIQPLHTLGMGEITREKAKAAFSYMTDSLSSPILVNVNHSKSRTPAGVAMPAATLLNQILVDFRYRLYVLFGVEDKLSKPKKLPDNNKLYGYILFVTSIISGMFFLFYSLRSRNLSVLITSKPAIFLFMLAGSLISILAISKVDFYKGDNKDSKYYNLDLMKKEGVMFFNTVNSDYWKATIKDIALTKSQQNSLRRTILIPYKFDDGSKGLAFMRNTIDANEKALTLLSKNNLQRLINMGGHCILYLHWNTEPQKYFAPDKIEFLENLRDYKDEIWITSIESLLKHNYAYAYLEFQHKYDNGKHQLYIKDFRDPVRGTVKVNINDLKNISFKFQPVSDIQIYINGEVVSSSNYEEVSLNSSKIITFR